MCMHVVEVICSIIEKIGRYEYDIFPKQIVKKVLIIINSKKSIKMLFANWLNAALEI